MTISRQVFDLSWTAARTDTGPAFNGKIRQMRWIPGSSVDTGVGIEALLMVNGYTDTGAAIPVLRKEDMGGSSITLVPKQSAHGLTGSVLDTGGAGSEPFYSAGSHLRIAVTPGAAAGNGKLLVYVED